MDDDIPWRLEGAPKPMTLIDIACLALILLYGFAANISLFYVLYLLLIH